MTNYPRPDVIKFYSRWTVPLGETKRLGQGSNLRLADTQPPTRCGFVAMVCQHCTGCRSALNADFDNARDASVYGDDTKSKWPKLVANGLQPRN